MDVELKKLEEICKDNWDGIEIARQKLVDAFNDILEEEGLYGEDTIAAAVYFLMNVIGAYIVANKDYIVDSYYILIDAER